MSVQIPDDFLELLTGPVVVVFVTVMPDGSPQASPVWCDYDGTHIIINSAEGRQKDKNVRANRNVSVLAVDPENPYRYLEVRGVVEEITNEGGIEVIDKLTKQYMGREKFFGDVQPAENIHTEIRVNYKIKPTKVITH